MSILEREHAATDGDVELSIVGEHYRERLRRRGRNPQSIRNFERAWLCLMAYACTRWGVPPRRLTAEQLEMFFATLPYAATTKKLYLAQIRAAFRYALAKGTVKFDPTIDIIIPAGPDALIKILPISKLREMRDNCYTHRSWLMFHLYAYTGCRKNEIRELTWDAVNLEDNTLFVVGKGGKSRLVPIHPALGEALTQVKPKPGKVVLGNAYGCPYHYTYYDKLLKEFAPSAAFHDFRRTVASSLDANGVEEGLIMKIMGWAPRTVFDRHYRNVAPERLQAAILRLYANDPL